MQGAEWAGCEISTHEKDGRTIIWISATGETVTGDRGKAGWLDTVCRAPNGRRQDYRSSAHLQERAGGRSGYQQAGETVSGSRGESSGSRMVGAKSDSKAWLSGKGFLER